VKNVWLDREDDFVATGLRMQMIIPMIKKY